MVRAAALATVGEEAARVRAGDRPTPGEPRVAAVRVPPPELDRVMEVALGSAVFDATLEGEGLRG